MMKTNNTNNTKKTTKATADSKAPVCTPAPKTTKTAGNGKNPPVLPHAANGILLGCELETAGAPVRAINCMARHHIYTTAGVVKHFRSVEDLMSVWGVGVKTAYELVECINQVYGMEMFDDVDREKRPVTGLSRKPTVITYPVSAEEKPAKKGERKKKEEKK